MSNENEGNGVIIDCCRLCISTCDPHHQQKIRWNTMNSAFLCDSPSLKMIPSSSLSPLLRDCKCKCKSRSSIGLNSVCISIYISPRCATSKANAKDDYHDTLRALKSRGRFPTKSLGQHYMLNSTVNDLLVKEAQVKDGDVILEIGPGTGSLTNVLVNAGAFVLAIEKDYHMAEIVSERFGHNRNVKVVQEDFTRCHIREHVASFSASVIGDSNRGQLARVISNLPFNITTEVLKLLLPMGDIFSHVVLLLQDETAKRLVGSASGTSEYRQINIFVNFYSEPEYKFKVPRNNFFPQPKVDAAIVAFRLKHVGEYPPVASPKGFFSMVNSAFNGKRKMLRKSLQHLHASPDIELALKALGLPGTSRPEELKMHDFVQLYNLLANQ